MPYPSGCLPPTAIAAGSSVHATLVADIAAGDAFGLFSGVAPGARVVGGHIDRTTGFTAGYDSSRAAIYWLITNDFGLGLSDGLAILNLSFGYPGNDAGANQFALFLDGLAMAENRIVSDEYQPLFVVAAGNDAVLIRKPGDLFNGITVGATDATFQRRLNVSGHVLSPDTRSKPDLLAPGSGVSDGARTSTGTSFAAPQVSGTAALLRQYGVDRDYFAQTAKAIVLNSARKRCFWLPEQC